jgi:hypothetical protein
MAYIGLQPQQKTLGTSTQKLSGNGIDFEFMLNRGVSKAADLRVFIGDTEQVPEVDYTATGTLLLFTNPPSSGTNNIVINYIAGALTTLNINANSYPVGTTTNPSIRSADAQSTGIYFPTTTSLGITVSGNTRLAVTDSPTAVSTSTGAVRVAGGLGMTGSLYTGGIVRIQDTTQAVSSASGALIVDGGMGIAKEVYIAGGLQVAGDFTVAGQFTTTGSDSLILNDPFIFLANANPGDNLDTGFVSSYFDGFNTRYTGFFRDITDGEYKLFNNLIVAPTTVVDTGNISFRYANIRVGNITADNIFGTIAGAASITTVGNLASLKVQTTVESWGINYIYSTQAATSTTTGALQVSGGIGVAGNVHAARFVGDASQLTAGSATVLQTARLLNGVSFNGSADITVPTNLGITAGTTAGPIVTSSSGTGATLPTASASASGVVTTGAQTWAGEKTFNSAITVPSITKSGTTGTGNIGQSNNSFNTIFAKATSAQYADVAERYLSDADYEPGTVLHFGGDYEVSQCNADACTRVAGVVSTNPAYIMNDSLVGEHVVELALLGRVPCKVEGTVQRGDMMVSAGNGRARAEANPKLGSVIGKALENFNGDVGVIEVVVGRN